MRKVTLIFVIALLPVMVFADPSYWIGTPYGPGYWFLVEEQEYDGDYLPIHKAGGVPMEEINYHSFSTIGSGDLYAGYFMFTGDYEQIEVIRHEQHIFIKLVTLMWPPSLITPGMVIPGRNNAAQSTYKFICRCTDEDDPFPPDSVRLADALGYWEYFSPVFMEEPYWDGYLFGLCHAHPCKIIPCPPGGAPTDKLYVYFTDSLYTRDRNIEEYETISGDSPLYIRADWVGDDPGVKHVRLYLMNKPDEYEIIELQDIGDRSMIGSYPSAKALGLESCDDAVVELYTYVDPDTSAIIGSDQIVVCLPKVTTSTDTMYILTDCMALNDNLDAGLKFVDDKTGSLVDITGRVDSAGYRYRSFWVANTSCEECEQDSFKRYYPSDSTYSWWDGETENCLVTFLRDSLYVVGGSLSVDAMGALATIENINNSFSVSTDTIINDTTRSTLIIMADQDPSNDQFSDSLELDIMRAITWQEYAGSEDESHCDGHYNPQWNNYWDHVTSGPGQETCYETLYPCENIGSSATGTMQILRFWWENVFLGIDETPLPDTYFQCSWDSLAWNWGINIFNGRYIIHDVNFDKMTDAQDDWDSLFFPENDYTPDTPNREDLSTYGFYEGWPTMRFVTKENWDKRVKDHDYVVNVRRFKDQKPWER